MESGAEAGGGEKDITKGRGIQSTQDTVYRLTGGSIVFF